MSVFDERQKLENVRVCSECGSDKTYVRKAGLRIGMAEWHYDYDGNLLCKMCYTTSDRRREYQRSLTARYKTKCITILGGKCVLCGSTDNLEIDHVKGNGMEDRVRFHNSMRNFYSYYLKHVDELLQKCRLLCRKCHGMSHRKYQRERSK